jgi:hypothetical protein
MPITFSIDTQRDYILEIWDGPVSAQELAAYWRSYLANPTVTNCRRTLVDMRNGFPLFTGEELEYLILTIVLPVLGNRHWRSALLVKDPLQFGVSRQYGVFSEIYSKDSIFYDFDAALTWLLKCYPDEQIDV